MPWTTLDYSVFMEKWFNSLFSHIENVRFIPRPSEDGVFGDSFCVAKRNWLIFPWDERQTDWSIAWAANVSWIIYPYTDEAKLYSLDAWWLDEITGIWCDYDATFSRDSETISYVWWWRYPSAAVEFTVTTWGTNNIVVSWGTLDSSYVGKYFYIASWWTGVRQRRTIKSITWSNTFVLWTVFDLTPLDVAAAVSDKIRVYNSIVPQTIYPRLRKTGDTDKLLSVDWDWNFNYFYFPNAKKIISYDNRLIQLHKDWTSILVSDNVNYEILDVSKIVILTNKCINIEKWWAYVILFFENEIWLLKKEIVDVTTGEYIYRYQSISTNVWLFSAKSYLIKGSDFYVFGSDNIPSTVSVTISSTWDVLANLKPFATLHSSYFEDISWGEVYIISVGQELRIVHVWDTETKVFINHFNTEWRTIDTFPWYNTNFMYFYYTIWKVRYTCFEDRVLIVWWLTDEWQPIRQYLKQYWPPQNPLALFKSRQTKFCFGNNWAPMWGSVRLTFWWDDKSIIEVDISNSKIVQKINTIAVWEESLWSSLMWAWTLWWDWTWADDLYMEYIDVPVQYDKRWMWTHYTVEVINETERDLIYFWNVVQVIPQSLDTVDWLNVI